MENVENPTALRVKNSFSIENILSRPETNIQRTQEHFAINNISIHDNSLNQIYISEKEKIQNLNNNDDPESNSEAASDDGNSSVQSKKF